MKNTVTIVTTDTGGRDYYVKTIWWLQNKNDYYRKDLRDDKNKNRS